MHTTLQTTLQLRNRLAKILDKTSLEDLNKVPAGFNNNVFWNIGHIVATHQLLVYSLAGERWSVDKEIVKTYRNGTKPERLYTREDVEAVKASLEASIVATDSLRQAGGFTNYEDFGTSTGFTVHDYESAISFNLLHEAMHLGIILTMIRLL